MVTGGLADLTFLVAKGVLPEMVSCNPCLTVSKLLVSEFFWEPFHNQYLPRPFLVVLILTAL